MAELDRIYQHLSWQQRSKLANKPPPETEQKAAENTKASLEYIRKTGGLDRL